jgi:general secretion pathway protein H
LHRRSGGFSLLELLVVVTIIGIFAGAAVLSLGVLGSDREIEQEVFRFRSLIDLLREEAVMESRDYGVLFSETGYRFYIYDYERFTWLDPIGDNFLVEHQLQEPLALSLALEGREVALEPDFDPEFLEEPEPQLIIFASGEMTPFEAGFYRGVADGRFLLTGELDGTLEVSQDGFRTP